MVYFVRHEGLFMVQAGCFFDTIDELEKAVREEHNCPWYLGLIDLHRKMMDND
jgi:hypothetical protein